MIRAVSMDDRWYVLEIDDVDEEEMEELQIKLDNVETVVYSDNVETLQRKLRLDMDDIVIVT